MFNRKRMWVMGGVAATVLVGVWGCRGKSSDFQGTPVEGEYSKRGMTKEMTAFGMGKFLNSLAVHHFLGNAPMEQKERDARLVKGGIEILNLDPAGFQMPRPASPGLTEKMADYLGYLIAPGSPGHHLSGQLREKHGAKIVAFFELAIKPYVGSVTYSKGQSHDITRSAAQAIETAGRESGLPQDVYEPVVLALRKADVDQKELGDRIHAMEERIESMLKTSLKK